MVSSLAAGIFLYLCVSGTIRVPDLEWALGLLELNCSALVLYLGESIGIR